MKFSALYKPTTLFSLRDSNSTSSGAKSLFLPSPYSIKMAFISQAISLGGERFYEDKHIFEIIRDTVISYHITGSFCVNNCFVKIQKQRDNEPFRSTVSFREYIYMDSILEVIFEVKNLDDSAFLQKYLHKINYFGKKGCFFQFLKYSDHPNEPNVREFNVKQISSGILQEYDDFGKNVSFNNINSYSIDKTKRIKTLLVLPISKVHSSKSFTIYRLT